MSKKNEEEDAHMGQEATGVQVVARCPHCGHHALSVSELRIAGAGGDIALICRACGDTSVLTVGERSQANGDELPSSITPASGAGADSGGAEQIAMLAKLDEAMEHSRKVGTCLETFVDPAGFAQVVPQRAMQILVIASALLDNFDEALATSREAIRQRW